MSAPNLVDLMSSLFWLFRAVNASAVYPLAAAKNYLPDWHVDAFIMGERNGGVEGGSATVHFQAFCQNVV